MPGLIGFSRSNIVNKLSVADLAKMADMTLHDSFYCMDKLFTDDTICSTRSHVNVIQQAAQPYQQDEIFVWLDGELYKQAEILNQYNLAEQSDPAILAALYQQHQNFEFLRHVEGYYVACLYDRSKQRLHLFSDRFGMRRLYWTVYQNSLVWAGELKALLALPDYQPKIDRAAVEDFLGLRYMIGERTWFEDVQLLPAASVLTWNIPEARLTIEKYWSWDELSCGQSSITEKEAVEALGHLLVEAVQSRVGTGERFGLTLSGGLDSRAILAALPQDSHPVNAITYGQKDCEDYRIAAQTASVAQDHLYFAEVNAENWLQSRAQTVWKTDASCSLMHHQFLSGLKVIRDQDLFDINLHGAWGDGMGGGHLFPEENFSDFVKKRLGLNQFKLSEQHREAVLKRYQVYFNSVGRSAHIMHMDNRIRSFTFKDIRISLVQGIETRTPFIDQKLHELLYTLPSEMLKDYSLYKKMLLQFFPKYYKRIPWQSTGKPIQAPNSTLNQLSQFQEKATRKLTQVGRRYGRSSSRSTHHSSQSYENYPMWIRQEPAHNIYQNILENPDALYQKYLSSEETHTIKQNWQRHLEGENLSDSVSLALTFEIWLQQLFNNKYRDEF